MHRSFYIRIFIHTLNQTNKLKKINNIKISNILEKLSAKVTSNEKKKNAYETGKEHFINCETRFVRYLLQTYLMMKF